MKTLKGQGDQNLSQENRIALWKLRFKQSILKYQWLFCIRVATVTKWISSDELLIHDTVAIVF